MHSDMKAKMKDRAIDELMMTMTPPFLCATTIGVLQMMMGAPESKVDSMVAPGVTIRGMKAVDGFWVVPEVMDALIRISVGTTMIHTMDKYGLELKRNKSTVAVVQSFAELPLVVAMRQRALEPTLKKALEVFGTPSVVNHDKAAWLAKTLRAIEL